MTLAILGLVWIGYIAWPVYDLFVLIRAIVNPTTHLALKHHQLMPKRGILRLESADRPEGRK
jgi:hypothetical protein